MSAAHKSAELDRQGRKGSKETRQRQSIEAPIESLPNRGSAERLLADVADGAGLSRGIVNFHFESKEKLLVETLRYLSDEYRAHWRRALHEAGPTAADKLWALVLARRAWARTLLMAVCAYEAVSQIVELSRDTHPSLLVLASTSISVLILIAVSSTDAGRWVERRR